jgi:hypothetical protein
MIPEWASTEDPAQPNCKAQWISDARALFKGRLGGVQRVLYYNKSSKYPNCRWFVDSSQASLTAFAGMPTTSTTPGTSPDRGLAFAC